MTEMQQTLQEIREHIATLLPEEQARIESIAVVMRVAARDGYGALALALVGAEVAAKES